MFFFSHASIDAHQQASDADIAAMFNRVNDDDDDDHNNSNNNNNNNKLLWCQ